LRIFLPSERIGGFQSLCSSEIISAVSKTVSTLNVIKSVVGLFMKTILTTMIIVIMIVVIITYSSWLKSTGKFLE